MILFNLRLFEGEEGTDILKCLLSVGVLWMYDLNDSSNHWGSCFCSFYQWGNGDIEKVIPLPKAMLRAQAVKSNGFVSSQTCYLLSVT